jgi:hypothetical protein
VTNSATNQPKHLISKQIHVRNSEKNFGYMKIATFILEASKAHFFPKFFPKLITSCSAGCSAFGSLAAPLPPNVPAAFLVTVGARDCAGVVLVDGTVTVAGGGGLSFGVTHRVGAALVALDTALVLPLLLPPPLAIAGFVTAVIAGFVTAGFVTANAAVAPAAAPLARTAVAPHLSFDLTSRGRSRLDSPPAVKGLVKGSSSSSLTPSI